MEPIISPWIIYVINTVDNVLMVSRFALFFSAAAFLAECIFYALADCYTREEADENRRSIFKAIKITTVPLVVSLILVLFVPTKETMLMMLGAHYATPDNIQAVQGNIVEFTKQMSAAIRGN